MIQGNKAKLILLSEQDAAFTARLRSDPRFNQFLSSQEVITEEQQRAWIRNAQVSKNQYNFKITDLNDVPKGTIAVYQIDNGVGEFGRFICMDPVLAIEAELLFLRFVFEDLKLKMIRCGSNENNGSLWKMHERYGFQTIAIKPNEKGDRIVYQELSAERFKAFDYSPINQIMSR